MMHSAQALRVLALQAMEDDDPDTDGDDDDVAGHLSTVSDFACATE